MEQALYDLPDGWEWSTLKSCCTFENGDRGKNYPSRSSFISNGIAVINAGCLDGKSIITNKLNRISQEKYDLISAGKIQKGDLLFCLRGSLGKCALISHLEKGVIASSLVIVRPRLHLIALFLLYYFNSTLCSKFIQHYNNGAAQPNLSAKNLSDFLIPLPLLPEQQRIVEKLDALLSRINKAIDLLRQCLILINQTYSSALEEAFNPLNAPQNSQDSKYDLPDGWEYQELQNVVDILGGATPSKNESSFWDGQIKWASVRDLTTDELRKTEFSISKKGFNSCSTNMIPKGSLIIATRVGLGKVVFVVNDVAINQDLKGLLPCKSINVKYLFYWLKSISVFIKNSGIGATVKGVKLTFIKSLLVPLPLLSEQQRIADKLDRLTIKHQQSKDNMTTQITQLEQLKASILDAAFKGEL